MKKSRSGYEETLGSNLVELPVTGADASSAAPSAMTNGVKETSPIEDLATLVQSDERCVCSLVCAGSLVCLLRTYHYRVVNVDIASRHPV